MRISDSVRLFKTYTRHRDFPVEELDDAAKAGYYVKQVVPYDESDGTVLMERECTRF